MKYPLFKVHVPKNEALTNIDRVFDSGFINEGEQVSELSKGLSNFLDVENLVLTNSCTSALTLALKALGVASGDEVLTISMTCVATNTPIANLGARIVWVDINPNTGSIDIEDLRNKITTRTKAIMFVAWAGNPCELDELLEIRREFGIPLIQDAAHAFDSRWNGNSISRYADFTCYSFQAIKHFTTGDGGAIVCLDNELFETVKKLKWFGYDRDAVKDEKGEWRGQRWDADIPRGLIGYKFNMNNIAAAIGLAQLPKTSDVIESHRRNGRFLNDFFQSSRNFRTLELNAKATSSNWVFTMIFKGTRLNRDKLLENLIDEGIGAGLVHLPNHHYSAFEEWNSDLPGTEAFARSQISLPCGWWINPDDCEFIAQRVEYLASKIEN